MDGLGVEILAHAALPCQQHRCRAAGDAPGKGLAGRRFLAPGDDGVEGVVGLADPVEHLPSPPLHVLHHAAKGGGVLLKGDHRQSAQQGGSVAVEDGVHIDEIDGLHLTPGLLEDGTAGLQHLRQSGAGPQIPEMIAGDVADVLSPALPVQEAAVGLVAEHDHAVRVDDQDPLPHGVEHLSHFL